MRAQQQLLEQQQLQQTCTANESSEPLALSMRTEDEQQHPEPGEITATEALHSQMTVWPFCLTSCVSINIVMLANSGVSFWVVTSYDGRFCVTCRLLAPLLHTRMCLFYIVVSIRVPLCVVWCLCWICVFVWNILLQNYMTALGEKRQLDNEKHFSFRVLYLSEFSQRQAYWHRACMSDLWLYITLILERTL